MWIATPTGFYSAVAHYTDPERVVVRTRALQDAEALARWVLTYRTDAAPASEVDKAVEAYKGSDYPWRVILTKPEWAAFLTREVSGITYTNFKNEVTKRQGKARHDVYSRVWSAMLAIEKLPGALKGHTKREVPHPRWQGGRQQPSTLNGTALTLDDLRWDDNTEEWEQELIEAGCDPDLHLDCTLHGCVAPDSEPECGQEDFDISYDEAPE